MKPGWNFFEKTETSTRFTDEELIIYKFFTTDDGQKALEVLKKWTIDNPSLRSMGTDGFNTAIMMAMFEGENNLVRKIIKILNKVSNGK